MTRKSILNIFLANKYLAGGVHFSVKNDINARNMSVTITKYRMHRFTRLLTYTATFSIRNPPKISSFSISQNLSFIVEMGKAQKEHIIIGCQTNSN